jgi:hypothetical protein
MRQPCGTPGTGGALSRDRHRPSGQLLAAGFPRPSALATTGIRHVSDLSIGGTRADLST